MALRHWKGRVRPALSLLEEASGEHEDAGRAFHDPPSLAVDAGSRRTLGGHPRNGRLPAIAHWQLGDGCSDRSLSMLGARLRWRTYSVTPEHSRPQSERIYLPT